MKIFLAIVLLSFPLWTYSQLSDIVAAEYFFDTDPGIGAATALPAFTANSNLDVTFLAASSGLSEGMHILGIRVQDNTTIWSIPMFLPVYVLANNPTLAGAEYFFDIDPGSGNATPLSITAGATIDVTFAANSSALAIGMHVLAVRTRDANGDWGIPVYTPFYIDQSRTISKLEYFFDSDPGSGNGTAIAVSPATDVLDQVYSMNSSALAIGSYSLNVRVAGQNNFWSMPESVGFSVTAAPPPTITSFNPTSGPIGTIVNITGNNFSSTPANNVVYFGAVRATVTAATTTQLTVTVPTGATFIPITVQVNGLTAYSQKPFVVTFGGGGTMDACSFAPRVIMATLSPGDQHRAAIHDLDSDGKIDLIVPDFSNNRVSVFRNISSGSITPGSFAPKIDFTTGTQPNSVAIGDIDGDGKPDLAIGTISGNVVSVFRNISTPGTIAFDAKVDFTIGSTLTGCEIHDLDGDGKPELVVTSLSFGLSVFLNTSMAGVINASSFASKVDFTTGPNPYRFSIGDLDGDNKPDVTVPNANAHTVSVFRNTSILGSVSFAPQMVLTTAAGTPLVGRGNTFTSLGDIDNDGALDLSVVNYTQDVVSIFLNNSSPGSLAFAAHADFAVSDFAFSPILSDLDGDGKIDFAFGGSNSVSVMKNNSSPGTLSFENKIDYSTTYTHAVGIADINGDGRNDLVTHLYDVAVFENVIGTISPPTITSFNPGIGPSGTTVVINGTNFNSPFGVSVEFNGVSAPLIDSTPGTITVGVPVGATTGPLSVTIGCNTAVSASNFIVGTPATIIITTQPSDAFACSGDIATFTTAATGTTNIVYQWQFSPDGNVFTDIINNTNYSGATTTTLSVNTSGDFGEGRYRCRVNGDFAVEVISNDEGLFINPAVGKPSVISSIPLVGNTITICSSSVLTLNAPGGFNSYLWTNGSTTQQITVTSSGTYSVTVGSAAGCISPASDVISVTVIPAPCNNQPPVFNSTSTTTIIGGKTTINLLDLISDVDNNLVSSSLLVIQQPVSGAPATIFNGILEIDYDGINFAGRDQLTIQVCDVFSACTQQILEIDVIGDIEIYNGVSPNSDDQNDIFLIRYIDLLPDTQENKVTIYNRWGSKVFEVSNYNNSTNVFRGLNDSGGELPSGTYFYKIEFSSGRKSENGYLTLKK